MAHSKLVSVVKHSPNYTKGRNHCIDTFSIHCMAGDLTVESCGNRFLNPSVQASSNYGIDSLGRIGCYVEEEDRSWCTSSRSNDNRAITIEVANDSAGPLWHISDKAYQSLINLLVDVCERNDIKELKWKADKRLIGQVDKQNMTVHRWFAAKACPGEYLYGLHSKIAKEVNKRLRGKRVVTVSSNNKYYRVQVGAFKMGDNAEVIRRQLVKIGYNPIIVKADGLFKVQVGAFSKKANAIKLQKELSDKGYKSIITNKYESPVAKPIYHKVRRGDTISEIAVIYSSSVKDIVAWNNIKNVNRIYVGQKLRVK